MAGLYRPGGVGHHRCVGFREVVLEDRRVRDEHVGVAPELFGESRDPLAQREDVELAAETARQLRAGAQSVQGRLLEGPGPLLRHDEDIGHSVLRS